MNSQSLLELGRRLRAHRANMSRPLYRIQTTPEKFVAYIADRRTSQGLRRPLQDVMRKGDQIRFKRVAPARMLLDGKVTRVYLMTDKWYTCMAEQVPIPTAESPDLCAYTLRRGTAITAGVRNVPRLRWTADEQRTIANVHLPTPTQDSAQRQLHRDLMQYRRQLKRDHGPAGFAEAALEWEAGRDVSDDDVEQGGGAAAAQAPSPRRRYTISRSKMKQIIAARNKQERAARRRIVHPCRTGTVA